MMHQAKTRYPYTDLQQETLRLSQHTVLPRRCAAGGVVLEEIVLAVAAVAVCVVAVVFGLLLL